MVHEPANVLRVPAKGQAEDKVAQVVAAALRIGLLRVAQGKLVAMEHEAHLGAALGQERRQVVIPQIPDERRLDRTQH